MFLKATAKLAGKGVRDTSRISDESSIRPTGNKTVEDNNEGEDNFLGDSELESQMDDFKIEEDSARYKQSL